jgi:hypothetical protein
VVLLVVVLRCRLGRRVCLVAAMHKNQTYYTYMQVEMCIIFSLRMHTLQIKHFLTVSYDRGVCKKKMGEISPYRPSLTFSILF